MGFTGRWVGNPGDLLIRIQWDWDIHGFYMEFSMDSCNGDIPTVSWEIHELNRPLNEKIIEINGGLSIKSALPNLSTQCFFRGEKVVVKGRLIFSNRLFPLDRKIGKPPWPRVFDAEKCRKCRPRNGHWMDTLLSKYGNDPLQFVFPICVPRHIIWLLCTAFIGAAAAT